MSPADIDLRAARCLVINMTEDEARRAHMRDLAASLGLPAEILPAVRASPGRIGCGLSHIKALRRHLDDRPLLILEDDVLTSGFEPVIVAPPGADAVYLGASAYGAIEMLDNIHFSNMVIAEDAGEPLVRVHNMLSTHAILYLSERFKRAAIETILNALLERDWAHDRGMARIQSDFAVYAQRRPMFYQAAALQGSPAAEHQEAMTRITINPLPEGTIAAIDVEGEWRQIVLAREAGRLRWRWA